MAFASATLKYRRGEASLTKLSESLQPLVSQLDEFFRVDGIELGQLVFVLGLALGAAVLRRIALPLPMPQRVAVYVMGSLAAFWTIERTVAIF